MSNIENTYWFGVGERKPDLTDTRTDMLWRPNPSAEEGLVPIMHMIKFKTEVVPDRYVIGSKVIAGGGMANIYKGYDKKLERLVAVKAVNTLDYAPDEQLEVEAKLMSALESPNIVKVYDLVRDRMPNRFGDRNMLIMEWLDPKLFPTLNTLIYRFDVLNPKLIQRIIENISSALDFMSKNGLSHRDVKPENIFVGQNVDKLGDLGVTRSVNNNENSAQIQGTLEFTCPEMLLDGSCDLRGDIFMLGSCAYAMFAGRSPFWHGDPGEIVSRTLSARYTKLSERQNLEDMNKEMLKAVDLVLSRVLVKNPDDRFQTAGEFAAAMKKALAPFV